MIKQIIISIFITLLVCTGIGVGLQNVFGFINAFVLALIVQIVGFYIFNSKSIETKLYREEQLINERLDILSKNNIEFECPCGKHIFSEIVYLNDSMTYKCPACDNNIKLNIVFTPVVSTTPLDFEKTLEAIKKLDEGTQV